MENENGVVVPLRDGKREKEKGEGSWIFLTGQFCKVARTEPLFSSFSKLCSKHERR